jgi:hypothetical protein
MLHNLSLSSCAYQVYSAIYYEDLSTFEDYSVNKNSKKYSLGKEEWEAMVERYEAQDKKAKRGCSKNVSSEDYLLFKDFFTKCYMCNEGFSLQNKPTFDRIDNSKPHTKENIKPCCLYCNCYKSDNDEYVTKLFIQLRKFAKQKNLPMLLYKGMEDLYGIVRQWITGGLSNVMNRFNIRGLTTIKNLEFNLEKDTVTINEGKIITHNLWLDANSLYPSSFFSIYLPWNRYIGGVMYIAGPVKKIIKDKDEAMKIIKEQKELIVCKLKGHIPPSEYNTPIQGGPSKYANVLNFPPIIRSIDIKT